MIAREPRWRPPAPPARPWVRGDDEGRMTNLRLDTTGARCRGVQRAMNVPTRNGRDETTVRRHTVSPISRITARRVGCSHPSAGPHPPPLA
eukprot:4016088-Prymnesium_polylepis.1